MIRARPAFGVGIPEVKLIFTYFVFIHRRHGPQWDAFRSKVQQVLLQSGAAKNYVGQINQVATDFMTR
jgi:hypothetical protein